jgi:aspartate ammonia-lyase
VQTLRAVENIAISGVALRDFSRFIDAFAFVKKAAALANAELGVPSERKRDAIAQACDEITAGRLHDQFVVDMIQGGAGTSTNMNVNEVIANRALEILGRTRAVRVPAPPRRRQLLAIDQRRLPHGVEGRRRAATRSPRWASCRRRFG